MGTEADRALLGNIAVICQLVGADTGAVFTVAKDGIRLRQSQSLHEHDIDVARGAFRARGAQLSQGVPVEIGMSTLWPVLADGRLEGVVYFDAPPPHALPLVALQRVVDQISRWLQEQHQEIEPAAPQLALYSPEQALRQQLMAALLRCGGNISATAAALGVTRQTVYARAIRLSVDLDRYRVGARRRVAATG